MTPTTQSENELAARWNERAEDARRAAAQAADPEEKTLLMEIAEAYDQLAVLAEAKHTSQE
jgi:hypothetical protein